MKNKLFTAALGLALTATAISASAQKVYKEGMLAYSTQMRGQTAEVKQYFTVDSSAMVVSMGPANIKILTTAKHDYLAIVLDVSVANIKKAGIATPAELEEAMSQIPTFTFTPGTETKQISGFNCKKVIAKDNKSGKTYDVWVTNDITVPEGAIPVYYNKIGGFPVQFTAFQQGQETSITIATISDKKAPAGTFAISNDFEKGSLADLNPGG